LPINPLAIFLLELIGIYIIFVEKNLFGFGFANKTDSYLVKSIVRNIDITSVSKNR